MKKISEKELERAIRHFNHRAVYVYIKGIIGGKNTIQNAKCSYDITKGNLVIYDAISEDNVEIEMSMAYQILLSKDRKILEIKIDDDQCVRIERIEKKIG